MQFVANRGDGRSQQLALTRGSPFHGRRVLPMADLETTNKVGLVLSGGGARGAYQLGCWRAFLERGIHFAAVAGSSIGALNGALVCQGDWKAAYELWTELTAIPIMRPDYAKLSKLAVAFATDVGLMLLPGPELKAVKLIYRAARIAKILSSRGFIGMLAQEGLVEMGRFRPVLARHLDVKALLDCPVKLFVTATRESNLINPRGSGHWFILQDHNEQEALDILSASVALPLIFGQIEVRGNLYRDGAISQKFPIQPLYETGLRSIVGVANQPNIACKTAAYPGCKITIVKPAGPLGCFPFATLRFTAAALKEWMDLGYADATRRLDEDDKRHQAGSI